MSLHLRGAREDDYVPIIAVVDDWWGGRHMAEMLPRLFFVHFQDTSFVIEDGDTGALAGFVVGFVSQSRPGEAYIHFVGVHPAYRRRGVGEQLYAAFFAAAAARGCTSVHSVTSPVNTASIAFHRRLGFAVEPGDGSVDGVAVTSNYDGRGQDRVRFVKRIGTSDED